MHSRLSPPEGFAQVCLQYGPYSPSKLLIARCAARFQGKYIIKDRIISDSIASARGSVIHSVLEQITKCWAVGESISNSSLQKWIEEGVAKYPAAYESIKLIRDSAQAYLANPPKFIIRETAKAECKIGIELFEQWSFLEDATPERQVVLRVLGNEEYPKGLYFAGTLDLHWVDERLKLVTVLDHKSTPSASKNADFDFQLGCYAFLASLLYPGYRIQTQIHYAHPDLNFYGATQIWEEDELEDVWQDVQMRIQAVEGFVEYPAVPGSGCSYCHMAQQCPTYAQIQAQNARGEINLNVRGIEDLQRLAGQVTVLGKLYDQINGALKEGIDTLCQESGIWIDGLWYGFKSSERVDWEATDRKIVDALGKEDGGLAGLLKRHNVKSEVFSSWRGEKMKALLKSGNVDLQKELVQYLVLVKETKFGSYKNV